MAIAHLEWTAGGGLEQEVWYKKTGDVSFTLYQTVSGATSTIEIPDIDPNAIYMFYVLNKCGFGLEVSSGTEEQALVTCPSLDIGQSALSLTVTFTHLGADVDKYVIELYEMPSETYMNGEDVLSPSGVVSVTFDGLIPDTYYMIKVIASIDDTYENVDCAVEERTLGCAEDYTLAPDGSYCYLIEEIAATPPDGGIPENTVAASNTTYSSLGSYIYGFGFNVNGTGMSVQISLSNGFWVNGPGDGGNHTTTDGPLNRCGLWTSSSLDDQDIGFAVCVDLPETKVYYIGIGGDNYCRIVIDGSVVVNQDTSAVDSQYFSGGSPFKVWHIFPVTLASGPHIIELLGHNDSGPASLGAEIYNNTYGEIASATSYGDLDLIFSTKDYIGDPVQLGSDDLGYSCPSGYSLAACEDPIICRRILTALPS